MLDNMFTLVYSSTLIYSGYRKRCAGVDEGIPSSTPALVYFGTEVDDIVWQPWLAMIGKF